MIAPPIPVPAVTQIAVSTPAAAPSRYSASANAFASLIMRTGNLVAAAMAGPTGTLRQRPGRFGRSPVIPLSMSTSPGTPIPIPATSIAAFSARSAFTPSIMRSITASCPSAPPVGTVRRAAMRFSPSIRASLRFVPPRSMPIAPDSGLTN